MSNRLLFVFAVALEVASWSAIFADWPVWARAAMFALYHGAASGVLAFVLQKLLPPHYRKPRSWGLVFLASVAFFIPFLGVVGLAVGVLLGLYLPRPIDRKQWRLTPIPDLPFRAPAIDERSPLGQGRIVGALRYARDPEKRLEAVMSTRNMRDQEAIPILRMGIRDPVDDVRLVAYAILERKEQAIYARIKSRLRLIDTAEPALKKRLHQVLALHYWELAYQGLAQGNVLSHVLEAARSHANAALEGEPNPGTLILLGRVLLKEGSLDEARGAFERAQALGLPASKVLPYLAEVAFRARRFDEVRACLLKLDPDARNQEPMSRVANYWLKEKRTGG